MKMDMKYMPKMVNYSSKPAKAKKGTDIQVDSLFYNTPARLKNI